MRLAAILILGFALPLVSGAQGSVRGTLYDSLRTSAPVADADVVVLGTGRKARTDAQGRFDIDGVPAGRHTLAFWAPWLDSLALPPIQATVDVTASGAVEARLATPSARSYQLAVCGTELDAEQGVLVGEIRGPDGAPMPNIGVSTRWTETRIATGMFERSIVAATDTSNAAGLYGICGVPVGSDIALRAIGPAGVGSNEIVLSILSRVQRRDLAVAPAGLRGSISGRVLGPDDRPLAGVTVAITGDSALTAQSDAEGRFTLAGVPRRSTQLVVRSVGFIASFLPVELTEETADVEDVRLARVPQELATVMVNGEPMTAARLQFDERRKRGLGMFIDDATLARLPVRTTGAVASYAPRTAVQQTPRGPMLMLRRGHDFCRPRFFIDGYDNGDISAEEERVLMERAKRIEIYTANSAPPSFNDFDGCGAVVVWTR